MDTLNLNMNHTKSIEFNSIMHDTMKKLNGVHNTATTHNTISSSSSNSCRSTSSSGSYHVNETKEDVRRCSEVNNNNINNDDECNKHTSNSSQNNAKDHISRMGVKIDKIQQPFDQNSAKTNGYVNGHSEQNRCTVVENFQNYHKPNR